MGTVGHPGTAHERVGAESVHSSGPKGQLQHGFDCLWVCMHQANVVGVLLGNARNQDSQSKFAGLVAPVQRRHACPGLGSASRTVRRLKWGPFHARECTPSEGSETRKVVPIAGLWRPSGVVAGAHFMLLLSHDNTGV
jgi:hypothetical protein